MDNWSDPTTWQSPYFIPPPTASARDYSENPDTATTNREGRVFDHRPPGEAYASGRGARGRQHGGPPPRGAFANRRGRGRLLPAPFSVDAEEFVPRNQHWRNSLVDGANWEDAPEFIPAAQQQMQQRNTSHTQVEGSSDTTFLATGDKEGERYNSGVSSDSKKYGNNFFKKGTNSSNSNNNNGYNEMDTVSNNYTDGTGPQLAHVHPRGDKRRTDILPSRGSTRGRGRGARGGWQPQQRRQQSGPDDPKNRNWREAAPEREDATLPAYATSSSLLTVGDATESAYSPTNRGNRVRERQWRGNSNATDRPRQVGSGRFPDAGSRRGAEGGSVGRYPDWQGRPTADVPEPRKPARNWVSTMGEQKFSSRDRDRGGRAALAQDRMGPGLTEQETESDAYGELSDGQNGGRRTGHALRGRPDSEKWKSTNARSYHSQDIGGKNSSLVALQASDTLEEQDVSEEVTSGSFFEEDSQSRKYQPADSGGSSDVGSLRNSTSHFQPFRGENDSDSGHRDRLSVQLARGSLECLVCCERVRPRDAVWSCASCHHVLHLTCTRRWARSSKSDSGGWPCPACRHEVPQVPSEYRCWCNKQRDPEWSPFEVPHSCGEVCGKPRGKNVGDPAIPGVACCSHRCTLLCHPGPCPPCAVQVNRKCGCGRETRAVVCGQVVRCGTPCGHMLTCGEHCCEHLCHPGPCDKCEAVKKQDCWCGKKTREVPCASGDARADGFTCDAVCGRTLGCSNHLCEATCHQGPCAPCALSPNTVTHCPCGKVALRDMKPPSEEGVGPTVSTNERESAVAVDDADTCLGDTVEEAVKDSTETAEEERTDTPVQEGGADIEVTEDVGHVRTSCLDPVPTCGQVCRKALRCGQPSSPHQCTAPCHTGPCPACPLVTSVKCRCGSLDKELPCCELTTRADDARCSRRCTKKRACGKHKCAQECCIEQDHTCPLVCNHVLSCGKHRCEEFCHRGNCRPCLQSSFDELMCECGAQVIEPPVPCGRRRPLCDRPCSRDHSCGHPPLHTCHSEPACPPCTVLVQRCCYGGHEMRKAVPCHQTGLSCGRPCGKDLLCGRHTCITPCHSGECADNCTQPCTKPRQLCGHPCAAPCHDGTCPDTPCREMVVVTCECGHRSTTRPCAENVNEYRRIATSLLAAKMTDVRAGRTVDLTDLAGSPRGITLKTLECNDECKIVERSRRLAIALQIRNPDLSAKLTPRYSDFMRQWAKKDPAFCAMVHEKLTELVKLAKESKQKSRSYSFDPMNRDKRHLVHEYCEHFGCESVAYDQEPKRNIVATASRDKAWLPSMSLLEVLQRESGQRKIPKPIMSPANRVLPALRPMEVLSVSNNLTQQQQDKEKESSSWVTTISATPPPAVSAMGTTSSASTSATIVQPEQQPEDCDES